MVLPLIGAAIGAGASLIGGAANRRAQKKANAANRPVNQVKEWEEAGINPLFGISSGGFVPHQATTGLGDPFATAGGQFQRGLELQHEDKIRETELVKENEKLRETLDDLATPRRPGYLQEYGGILPLPSNGDLDASSKNPRTDVSGGNTAGVPHGDKLSGLASGRELEVAPITSGPGLTEINNDLTGPVIVPGADGEPWGIDELATFGLSVPFNLAYRFGGWTAERVDAYRTTRKMNNIYRDVRAKKKAPVPYNPGKNKSPRKYYGPHGSRTGF